MSTDNALKFDEAMACAVQLKKLLLSKGQWFRYIEEYTNEGIKFLKIEGSIKIKQ